MPDHEAPLNIFVLGTGRSGTHWVGHILAGHPEIRATIEKSPIFEIATQAAVRPRRRAWLLPVLHSLYAYEELKSRPLNYADKSHPIIWYADTVGGWFPESRFVAVERSPFGTVASMLHHSGVNKWQRSWRRYGVPNPFLGIDRSNAHFYGELSSVEKAAFRWVAHHRQTQYLRDALGHRLLVMQYETMIDQFHREMDRLWKFLGLNSIAAEPPKPESRDAWKASLSDEDLAKIERITGIPPY